MTKNKYSYLLILLAAPILLQAQNVGRPAHLAILKRDQAYTTKQAGYLPHFTYQDKNAPELVQLRQRYALDSVAGTGSDIQKAIRLLGWMHWEVPHEDEYNHQVLNARNIIDTYREKKIAQGCYPIAIAMNEIFLAMGYRSRVIICFSSDLDLPNGGHVINIVYIPSFKKWIWMDPQFNAYLKDGKGAFLSIAEVRTKLIKGQPVVLNKDANYHNEAVTSKYYLFEFMLEHLYRFISPLHSQYDSETRTPGKTQSYVELLPLNSKVPVKGTFENTSANGPAVITYHTRNATAFWKIP